MPEQLTLDGRTVHSEDLELGRAQRAVMEAVRAHPNLTADEAGAIVHELRGRHHRDSRCAFCGSDGAELLESLERRGLLDEGAAQYAAAAPSSSGPVSTSVGLAARARSTDPATSHAAAVSVGDPTAAQEAVLSVFSLFGPLTDERLVLLYEEHGIPRGLQQQSPSGIRTRRHELTEQGRLAEVGRSKTKTGRRAIVWGKPYDPSTAAIPF